MIMRVLNLGHGDEMGLKVHLISRDTVYPANMNFEPQGWTLKVGTAGAAKHLGQIGRSTYQRYY